MKTIYKYHLVVGANQHITMPKGSRILHVHTQETVPTLWVECAEGDDGPVEDRVFHVIGTGGQVPEEPMTYLGTTHCNGFVWHVYEGV